VLEKELDKIIDGCQKGDRIFQRKLYEQFSGLLMTICLRYARNEAKDLLQMSFVKIFKNINKYKGNGSFEGWVKRITVNTAISHYHKKNVLKHSDDITDFNNELQGDIVGPLSKMNTDELMTIINSLPDKYRITFNLYAIEGYKHNEIAEMLDISEGTSKSQLSRARKMIQLKLEQIKELENEHTI